MLKAKKIPCGLTKRFEELRNNPLVILLDILYPFYSEFSNA